MSKTSEGKFSGEDFVVVALVLVGIAGGLVAAYLNEEPIIVAVLFGLGISSAIYRFLGGAGDAAVLTKTIRLGGTAAVFLIIAWFVDDRLAIQTEIEPSPETWVAIDHTRGLPVSVKVNGLERSTPNQSVLENHVWGARFDDLGLRLFPQSNEDFTLGYVGFRDLQKFSLFNSFREPEFFRFTDRLGAGQENVDLEPYRFRLNVTRFADDVSHFEIVSPSGQLKHSGGLRNKRGEIAEIDGRYFLVFVVAAVHNEADKWVKFGFGELIPSLERPSVTELATSNQERTKPYAG